MRWKYEAFLTLRTRTGFLVQWSVVYQNDFGLLWVFWKKEKKESEYTQVYNQYSWVYIYVCLYMWSCKVDIFPSTWLHSGLFCSVTSLVLLIPNSPHVLKKRFFAIAILCNVRSASKLHSQAHICSLKAKTFSSFFSFLTRTIEHQLTFFLYSIWSGSDLTDHTNSNFYFILLQLLHSMCTHHTFSYTFFSCVLEP
jgi:hypothetical protein